MGTGVPSMASTAESPVKDPEMERSLSSDIDRIKSGHPSLGGNVYVMFMSGEEETVSYENLDTEMLDFIADVQRTAGAKNPLKLYLDDTELLLSGTLGENGIYDGIQLTALVVQHRGFVDGQVLGSGDSALGTIDGES